MKFAILSLAAAVSALAPRERPPMETNPVEPTGATTSTPQGTFTILPIVGTSEPTSSDKVTIPTVITPPNHPTHTMPSTSESSTAPGTGGSTGSSHSSESNSSHSSSTGAITTHNSTTTTGTGTGSSSGASSTGASTTGTKTGSPTGNGAAIQTANVMAGIAAIAGFVMVV
ncbi:hypothetical protein PWT90_08983 [Aphanocladium album]|nr:hypothetical protein PWT90_08983 [Aphanocladium album]